jgi:L-asparaginase
LIDAGCPVVVASRCHEGRTHAIYGNDSGGVTLVNNGAILAGDLSAVKARLLLSALLGKGLAGDALTEACAAYT